jgi:hypothetical protein
MTWIERTAYPQFKRLTSARCCTCSSRRRPRRWPRPNSAPAARSRVSRWYWRYNDPEEPFESLLKEVDFTDVELAA